MNKEEYKKAYEKASEDIRKAEEELESILKMAKLKEEELDERRENLLVNLMEMDKNVINDDEETEPEDAFTFVGETPGADLMANSKSIVLHFRPFKDNNEMKADDVAIALERGVDSESALAALMFAVVEVCIAGVNEMNGKKDMFEGINKAKVAVKALEAVADILLEEEKSSFIDELLASIFGDDDEDEEEEDDD